MSDPRRRLPAVGALLEDAERAGLLDGAPRTAVTAAIRATLTYAREHGGEPPADGWLAEVTRRVSQYERPSLTRVVNGTGVVLHTNLGRAPFADAAVEAVVQAAGYSALEYDREAGERGSRQRHVHRLLTDLTGAEDALVVVNAAAALFLTLHALAGGGETLVSRGELVAIGGGFRIPDILAESATVLTEVGTTNRTSLRDYELALSARTRLALKVHRSNFAMHGFVQDVAVEELIQLCRQRGIPVVHDVGSGLLVDLSAHGLTGEPLVPASVAAGALTVFSGDKLLGGPQAGVIAGAAELVERLRDHPLARALRPDKTALAALEATLRLYQSPETAFSEIPVLAMLTADPATLKRRARRLARRVDGAVTEAGTSSVGGGAFPDAALPTTLVAVPTNDTERVLDALRRHDPPVIARAAEGRVLFDVRTVADAEFPTVIEALAAARP